MNNTVSFACDYAVNDNDPDNQIYSVLLALFLFA